MAVLTRAVVVICVFLLVASLFSASTPGSAKAESGPQTYQLNLEKSVITPFALYGEAPEGGFYSHWERTLGFTQAKYANSGAEYDNWVLTLSYDAPQTITIGVDFDVAIAAQAQKVSEGQFTNPPLGPFEGRVCAIGPFDAGGDKSPASASVYEIATSDQTFTLNVPDYDYEQNSFKLRYCFSMPYYVGTIEFHYEKVGVAQQPKECNAEPTALADYDNGIWKFKYQTINEKGLVITAVTAADKPIFDSVSVPFFKLEHATGSKTIKYCAGVDNASGPTVESSPANGIDVLRWGYEKKFDEEGLKGTLAINYEIFASYGVRKNCEASATQCYRLIPRVTYTWVDSSSTQPTLALFQAYYRLEYGNTGIALVKDSDSDAGSRLYNLGPNPLQTNETRFFAVTNGQPGIYDNIHTALPGKGVFIPGCTKVSFECAHNHWRWTHVHRTLGNLGGFAGYLEPYYGLSETGGRVPNVDPMVDPVSSVQIDGALRGTPYLVKDQTIEIAIVKNNPNEEPNEPELALGLADNAESIATLQTKTKLVRGEPTEVEDPYTLGSAEDVVAWYVALVRNKATDSFNRHGIFVLDTSKTASTREAYNKLYELVYNDNTIETNKKNEMLWHMYEALQDKYWTQDGLLNSATGATVFQELSAAAANLQQAKYDNAAIAQSTDLYTAGLLSLTQRMVDDTLWSEVGKIKTGASDESQIESTFSSNQALSSSLQAYDSAASETDPNNASIAISNFGSAWQSSIQGFDEVSDQLVAAGSLLPPDDSTDSTPPVSDDTPRGEPFSASTAFDAHTFTITGESDAAKVTSFSILPDESVTLYVEGQGLMEISVPTALIQEIYLLLADGEYLEFSKLAVSEEATTILLDVPAGASSIEMIGLGVVPEFPGLMLLLTLTLVLCSTIIAARYLFRK